MKVNWSLKAATAKSVQRLATGLTIGILGFDSRQGLGIFFLWHRVQIGSGSHPASYPRGNGGSFPEGKVAGAWS
jgi:hypothetical protein